METPTQIGRYVDLQVLGAGGMGTVFLGQDPERGTPVAIKVLHEQDPETLLRFKREAEAMARIRDPHVVKVLDAGVSELGPYLVLEYCPGADLKKILEERGPLAPSEAAALVGGVSRGVAAAHAAGVFHRDLKPANVLVDADNRPKVTDFGIAKTPRGLGVVSLTQSGVILGTPAYMSPEQLTDAREVDARSDVYALGVILYECLAGRAPFQAPTKHALIARIVEGDPDPLPSDLPPELVEVVTCAMALDPADRFSSAEVLAESLAEFVASSSRGHKTPPAFIALATLVALLLLALVGLLWPQPDLAVSATPLASQSSPASSAPLGSANPTSPASPASSAPLGSAQETVSQHAKLADPNAVALKLTGAFERGDLEALAKWLPGGLELGVREAHELTARLERMKRSPDMDKCAEHYRIAADLGSYEGLCGYARCLALGSGVPKDRAAARACLARAESLSSKAPGVAFERARLAWIEGRHGEWEALTQSLLARPEASARRHLWGDLGVHLQRVARRADPAGRKLAREGALIALSRAGPRETLNGQVAHAWGEALAEGQIPLPPGQDRAERVAELYERSAKLDDTVGIIAWGTALLLGQGCPRDVTRGLELLEEAAKRGWLTAYERLGLAYLEGLDGALEKDEERAIRNLEQAARQNSLPAMRSLTEIFFVRGELEAADRHAKRAHDLGDSLGSLYYSYLRVLLNKSKAEVTQGLSDLREFAKTYAIANDALADVYTAGKVVEADPMRAAEYLRRAAALRRAWEREEAAPR
ncbi:MAG: protein kinase [Planctomycetes bacterium]|nr:protein kinase [Planctomycetota bacterium]